MSADIQLPFLVCTSYYKWKCAGKSGCSRATRRHPSWSGTPSRSARCLPRVRKSGAGEGAAAALEPVGPLVFAVAGFADVGAAVFDVAGLDGFGVVLDGVHVAAGMAGLDALESLSFSVSAGGVFLMQIHNGFDSSYSHGRGWAKPSISFS